MSPLCLLPCPCSDTPLVPVPASLPSRCQQCCSRCPHMTCHRPTIRPTSSRPVSRCVRMFVWDNCTLKWRVAHAMRSAAVSEERFALCALCLCGLLPQTLPRTTLYHSDPAALVLPPPPKAPETPTVAARSARHLTLMYHLHPSCHRPSWTPMVWHATVRSTQLCSPS